MSNDLTVIEENLGQLAPRLEQLLPPGFPVARLNQTIMISMERTPTLRDCSLQSIFQCALTFATLGLEVDGATGQGYMIPFKGKATPVIGYKGFNTLAMRAGFVITASVVREKDNFSFKLGTGAYVDHKPWFGTGGPGHIVGAYAIASRPSFENIIVVMTIEELMEVKSRAPGGHKKDSPWNDPRIGFPAMCEKTCRRRLARSMPLSVFTIAAAMDEAVEERGRRAYIDADTQEVVVEGGEAEVIDQEPAEVWVMKLKGDATREYPTAEAATEGFVHALDAIRFTDTISLEGLDNWWKKNEETIRRLPAEKQSDLHQEYSRVREAKGAKNEQ